MNVDQPNAVIQEGNRIIQRDQNCLPLSHGGSLSFPKNEKDLLFGHQVRAQIWAGLKEGLVAKQFLSRVSISIKGTEFIV